MSSFKGNIINQIEQFGVGKIFTFSDLEFPRSKVSNVAVILSQLSKEQKIKRIEKGAYYKPQISKLGLGILPVYQDEQFEYLTNKFGGYITGAYIYNKFGLTEQVATMITIATPTPFRRFKFKNLNIESVKAYHINYDDVYLLRLLDAIKDIKQIAGASQSQVYERIITLHISKLEYFDIEKLVLLAMNYPPRVRKVLSDIMEDMDLQKLQQELIETILPTTRFDFNYKQ